MSLPTSIGPMTSISSIWEEIIFRTTPTNEKKCEAALNFVYAFNRMKPPTIKWFDDHYAAEKYLATQKRAVKVGDKFWQNMYNQLHILSSSKKQIDISGEFQKIGKYLSRTPKIGYPGIGRFSIMNWGKYQYLFMTESVKPEVLTRAIDLCDATGYYLTYDLVLAVRNPEYIYISNVLGENPNRHSSNYYIQYRNGPTYCRFLNYNVNVSEFEKLDSHQFDVFAGSLMDGFSVACKRCNYKTKENYAPRDIYSCDEMVIKDILE